MEYTPQTALTSGLHADLLARPPGVTRRTRWRSDLGCVLRTCYSKRVAVVIGGQPRPMASTSRGAARSIPAVLPSW